MIISEINMEIKQSANVYSREKYLQRIRPFYNSDIIKVITGIRRCGKTFILRAIINELLASGTDPAQILYLPLDRRGFKNITTPDQLEEKIESMIVREDFNYLFIDEVQNVKGFESVVHAFQEEGYSVFLTGSNSYLLSDEITTKLTGRYLSFEIFTLNFDEYLHMKDFYHQSISADMRSEFDEYILNGGFPKALEIQNLSDRQFYTREIVHEIFEKDVKCRKHVSNIALYERIQSFIISNYAPPFSLGNLVDALKNEGISTKPETIRKYIDYLKQAKIVYECNRFDLKSKKSLRREQKYYLADLSLYFAANVDNRLSYGPSLENLIYIYLRSNNYQVYVGKIGALECDFIVRNQNQNYAYIQVVYSLQAGDEKIRCSFRNVNTGHFDTSATVIPVISFLWIVFGIRKMVCITSMPLIFSLEKSVFRHTHLIKRESNCSKPGGPVCPIINVYRFLRSAC